ncbi:LPXTG cell wall anchor domain-containing protein [Streptomyces canus]|uniref:LPXTG cell wall anchor domain-containing protein n=1 Tax=Streptomyces doebereineriae TaxID=3075528 RepID=A0ABU2VKI5_9ACTN|nr:MULTISPECIES: LPXTG cell wall anchor domain-containing protein [Streptomyces]WSZ37211.1 LPXTG cell wall anchor domain-containing protein [Streptomyces sp. NBC_00882]MCX4857419.1 LPXTG cell wall anchor domain-containing protein [Streptomyces canus]MDT0486109.1 LPXTG cell wall anchor domain-containing protein [Streptomyces sp. DSM 41640]WSD92196.1 LPXTG cell wall anchor domain-containing protein [Streptomyces canus]WSW41087.1 LPXTG cell wall anchor domain-containing protein [Streptomyces canu
MLTATAAGTLLGALWFVPSANATQDSPARTEPSPQVTAQARVTTTSAETSVDDTRLADTGSFDTTPYVVGGTLFLTLGAGFVVYSVRRERLGF